MSGFSQFTNAFAREHFGPVWDDCDDKDQHVNMLLILLGKLLNRVERKLDVGKNAETVMQSITEIGEYIILLDDETYDGPLKPEQIH